METILLSFAVEADVPPVVQAVGQVVQGIVRTQFNHFAYIERKGERYYLKTSDRVVSREALCVAIANVTATLFRGVANSFAWKHEGKPLLSRRPPTFPLPGLALRKLGSAHSPLPNGCRVDIECGAGLGRFSINVGSTLGIALNSWEGVCTGQVAGASYEGGVLVATMRFRRSNSRSFLIEDQEWIESSLGRCVTVVLARCRGHRCRWRLDYSVEHRQLFEFPQMHPRTMFDEYSRRDEIRSLDQTKPALQNEWWQPELFSL